MAEESDLERTEPASGRRLEQAREEGQVAHSRELGTFLVLIVAAASFWVLGGWMMQRFAVTFRSGLVIDADALLQPTMMLTRFGGMVEDALVLFLPLLGALLLASIAGPFFLNSIVFAPKALQPNFGRLNPLSGIKRIISWSGLIELLKAVGKAGLIGGVAVWVIWGERDALVGLMAQPLDAALVHAGEMVTFSFLLIVVAMALIVAIDVPFQIWQYHEKLKMTREEVKQEAKQMEGDPMVKGRIRSLQRQAARRRMMAAVPQADVIVTNPTHFAVALSYKTGMAAPRVVAKGMGAVAQRIKEIGAEHGVAMLEAPPLARALHRHVEIDDSIPAGLYAAVAEALAWVYQLKRWRSEGGQYPVPPGVIEVPAELVPEVVHG